MKGKTIIIGLLIICIILLILDISTGIWFWNRVNLLFNSSNFNNILTPIISFLAFIIYALALYMTIKQNKILLSQNIKPFYEKRIDELIINSKKNKINYYTDDEIKECHLLEYINVLNKKIIELGINKDYLLDLNRYRNGIIINKEYLKTRSYYGTSLFLAGFSLPFNPDLEFYYNDIIDIIEEVNLSKMIKEDKILINKRIKHIFLRDYIAFFEYIQNHKKHIPPIPIIDPIKGTIEFTQLSETGFKEYYIRLKTIM